MADAKRSRASLRGVRTKRRNAAISVGRGRDATERDPDAQLLLDEAHGGVPNLSAFKPDMRGCAPHKNYAFRFPSGRPVADGLSIQTAQWRRTRQATTLLRAGETVTVAAAKNTRFLLTVETPPAPQTAVTDRGHISTRTCTGLLRCTIKPLE